MIQTRVKTKLDTARLKKRVDAASFNSLGHAGRSLRSWAQRSIKRRKNPSQPGRPAHTRSGNLKRAIRYDLSPRRDSVAAGPIRNAGRIWQTLEHGGRPQVKHLSTASLRIGGWGPIKRRSDNRFDRVQLRTAAQVARAQRLLGEENARRTATGKRINKPRPTMQLTLQENRNRLPKSWQNSLR